MEETLEWIPNKVWRVLNGKGMNLDSEEIHTFKPYCQGENQGALWTQL